MASNPQESRQVQETAPCSPPERAKCREAVEVQELQVLL